MKEFIYELLLFICNALIFYALVSMRPDYESAVIYGMSLIFGGVMYTAYVAGRNN